MNERACPGIPRLHKPCGKLLLLADVLGRVGPTKGLARWRCPSGHSTFLEYELAPVVYREVPPTWRHEVQGPTVCVQCGQVIERPTSPGNTLHPACRVIRRAQQDKRKRERAARAVRRGVRLYRKAEVV